MKLLIQINSRAQNCNDHYRKLYMVYRRYMDKLKSYVGVSAGTPELHGVYAGDSVCPIPGNLLLTLWPYFCRNLSKHDKCVKFR